MYLSDEEWTVKLINHSKSLRFVFEFLYRPILSYARTLIVIAHQLKETLRRSKEVFLPTNYLVIMRLALIRVIIDGCSWSLRHYQNLSEHTCKHFQLTRQIVRLRQAKSWLFKCAQPCPWCLWKTTVYEGDEIFKEKRTEQRKGPQCAVIGTPQNSSYQLLMHLKQAGKRTLHTSSWSLSE